MQYSLHVRNEGRVNLHPAMDTYVDCIIVVYLFIVYWPSVEDLGCVLSTIFLIVYWPEVEDREKIKALRFIRGVVH